MNIENTQQCFVKLWLRLERTRRLFKVQNKRFCIRRILQYWFGSEATDDFIWEVCYMVSEKLVKDEDDDPVYGWDELPPPKIYPRKHRELLRAIVAVSLNISSCKVHLKKLDKAYSIAFPKSTPINISKKSPSDPLLASPRGGSKDNPSLTPPRGRTGGFNNQ